MSASKTPYIVLTTPTPPDISSFGVRSLSAYLKRAGYRVRTIFFPGGIEELTQKGTYIYQYPTPVIEDFISLCAEADIVGISFFSQYIDRALQLTKVIKERLSIPVIWGGVHATLQPEESLSFADMVCVGEGEIPLRVIMQRIATGDAFDNIPGIWSKKNGEIIQTGAAECIEDLDMLPHFDFSLSDQYLLNPHTMRIELLDETLLAKALPLMPYFKHTAITVYRTMTTRGCPHLCTYCANQALRNAYKTHKYLRMRSALHVMDELKTVVSWYPFIKGIHFFDDVFTSLPVNQLKDLCALYKAEIGLPFYCQVSPATINRDIMELLIDAGMVFIEMGIQTASEKTQAIYERAESLSEIRAATQLFASYRKRLLTTRYHIILDNPWEPQKELIKTLHFLTRIPKPFMLCISSLTFYPGTELYERAKKEGLIQDEYRDIYRKPFYKPSATYLNLLIVLSDVRWIPGGLLRFLSKPAFIRLFHSNHPSGLISLFFRIEKLGRLSWKGLEALGHADIKRIFRYFKRIH